MNASDFPLVPHELSESNIEIPSDDLTKILTSVLFSVSADETRPVLTGVLIIFNGSEVSFVATDGFRLSQKKTAIQGLKEERRLILPKNSLSEIVRLAGESEKVVVSFKKDENQVLLGVNNSVLATRIIEGEFPDFERIIPKDPTIKISVDKEDLLRSVKLASIFARDSGNVLKLFVSQDSLEISAESQIRFFKKGRRVYNSI
jgi:DNA polymerase-3 subunit beta